ncbi:hypothetical protein [Burkholderia multivorans]|uniref:hypothetical protein n=1 Tax=Burkholderia multivorans TaxID=87883 RepID=UPI0021BEB9EF|nr:hypothetical protein [Burkholderia multivorans]
MTTYARLDYVGETNMVVEVIEPPVIDGTPLPIGEMFTAEFVATLVDITNIAPQPEQWWTSAADATGGASRAVLPLPGIYRETL